MAAVAARAQHANHEESLAGTVALVTGGTRGIRPHHELGTAAGLAVC